MRLLKDRRHITSQATTTTSKRICASVRDIVVNPETLRRHFALEMFAKPRDKVTVLARKCFKQTIDTVRPVRWPAFTSHFSLAIVLLNSSPQPLLSGLPGLSRPSSKASFGTSCSSSDGFSISPSRGGHVSVLSIVVADAKVDEREVAT